MVEKHFGVPTSFLNDATAAMYAEYERLKITDPELAEKSGVLFTIGTGLGGGLVQEQTVIIGENGQAAEFGHLPMVLHTAKTSVDVVEQGIECGCGEIGHAEQFANLAFIEREVEVMLSLNPKHVLAQYTTEKAAKRVLTQAANGDPLCQQIIMDQGYNLGTIGRTVIAFNDPGWMIIGGGITDTTPAILNAYLAAVHAGLGDKSETVEVRYAAHGENSGWMGAAASAVDRYHST